MHTFRFSEEWGRKLSTGAPKLGRAQGTLVKANAQVVADGGFDLPEGDRVVVPTPPPTERIVPPGMPLVPDAALKFDTTIVTVALVDTLSAALMLGDGSAALNFANAHHHGGGYYHGARAQEEDLCRLLPQLICSLEYVPYPIKEEEGECLLTRGLLAVRKVGTYKLCRSQGVVNMLTAAMPCGDAGPPGQERWNNTVSLRVRGVLHAAKVSGFAKLVLGAWGCGAFGNPPDLVAQLFRVQLASAEFRGAFSEVVFAIIDPMGDGNFKPFFEELSKMDESEREGVSKMDESERETHGGYQQVPAEVAKLPTDEAAKGPHQGI